MPTETKKVSNGENIVKSTGISIGCAFFIICMGITFLLIPIIGWIIGPILILMGIIFALAGPIGGAMSSGKVFKGPCPYCNSPLTVNLGARSFFDCPKCGERVIGEKGMFYTREEFKELNRRP